MINIIKRWFQKQNSGNESTSLKERFSEIYFNNIFGGKDSRSGEGSNMIQTEVIRQAIPNLIREFDIRTFMDAPCGDWYWMKETRLNVEQYIGIDIVDAIIEKNHRDYGNSSTIFQRLNLVEDPLPQADLIFCRDCLVHLTFADIRKAIANFKKSSSTYLLTTTFTERSSNADLIGKDIWRPLNLELPPFNFPKPLKLINEHCTEGKGLFGDKHLGLWRLDSIP